MISTGDSYRYWAPVSPAVIQKYHKPGGLKQWTFTASQFWRPEAQNHGVGRALLPPRSLGGAPSSSLPAVTQTPRILFSEHRLRTSEDQYFCVWNFLPGRVLSVWRPWTMSLLFRRASLIYVEHPGNNTGLCETLWDEFHTLCATGTEKRERSYGWEQLGMCFWGCGTLKDLSRMRAECEPSGQMKDDRNSVN